MRGERKETVTLVRACLQAAESIGTREQSRAHPSPSPAALKEKFYKGKDKILDPPPPALPHSVWAPPSTRLFVCSRSSRPPPPSLGMEMMRDAN